MTRPRTPVLVALVALVALLAAVVAGCGDDDAGDPAAGASTAGTARAEVILDWFPNADHAGLYAAREAGAFADQDLEVTLTVPSDPAAALKQVGAGRAPFAISYTPEVLLARSRGVPVVAVGALVGQPLNAVIARTDRGVTRPRDLEGKTVGIAGVPSDRPLLESVVRADGGDPSKVRTRTVGFSLSPALAAGKVDAVIGAYWNIEVPELEAKGVEVTVLRLEEHGVPTYDELVVVTSDTVRRERPDLVRRFLAALRIGQERAAADPAAAAATLARENEDLSAEALPRQVALTAPLLAPEEGAVTLDPADWSAFADWMRAEGLLTREVDPADAVTAEFLPEG